MPFDMFRFLLTVINFAILAAIIVSVIKAIRVFRNFLSRSKEMDKKLDEILNRLEDK